MQHADQAIMTSTTRDRIEDAATTAIENEMDTMNESNNSLWAGWASYEDYLATAITRALRVVSVYAESESNRVSISGLKRELNRRRAGLPRIPTQR